MARAKTNLWTRSLEKLRGAFVHAPSQPGSGAAKKTAQSAGAATQSSASGTQAQATDASKAQDKAPHKKMPAQPWYRHRQRW